jgi:predicted N-formylglutamate amidohydrolase
MNDAELRLLAADDPAPVRVLRPQGRSNFLLTADHAGRAIPRRLAKLGVSETELDRHIAWDIGIAGVTERLSDALDATAVLQAYSRLVIDCNRRPEWPSATPEISEATRIPGNEGISATAREARRREIFDPYHTRIGGLLDARRDTGWRTVLVAMHSFTPVFKGEARSVEVGILYNPEASDIRLPSIMLELLRAEGDLVVGDNAPYAITGSSDYTVPVHGEGRGLPHVEIEIRQDLIADPAGQTAWAARLARLLPAADARLREAEA